MSTVDTLAQNVKSDVEPASSTATNAKLLELKEKRNKLQLQLDDIDEEINLVTLEQDLSNKLRSMQQDPTLSFLVDGDMYDYVTQHLRNKPECKTICFVGDGVRFLWEMECRHGLDQEWENWTGNPVFEEIGVYYQNFQTDLSNLDELTIRIEASQQYEDGDMENDTDTGKRVIRLLRNTKIVGLLINAKTWELVQTKLKPKKRVKTH
jgi:hypothetical protein